MRKKRITEDEEEEEKGRCWLEKVYEGDFFTWCSENRDICNYCSPDFWKDRPCIFYKRILIMKGSKIEIYKIHKWR